MVFRLKPSMQLFTYKKSHPGGDKEGESHNVWGLRDDGLPLYHVLVEQKHYNGQVGTVVSHSLDKAAENAVAGIGQLFIVPKSMAGLTLT
jgi:hypothetical protein